MLKVSDLSEFVYCKRKYYLVKKLALEIPRTKEYVKINNLKKELKSVDKALFIDKKPLNFSDDINTIISLNRNIIKEILERKKLKPNEINFNVDFDVFLESKDKIFNGKLDELIAINNFVFPVKFKMNSARNGEIWPTQKITLAAYSNLVDDNLLQGQEPVDEAFIIYLENKLFARLFINNLSIKKINKLVHEANALVKKDVNKIPKIIQNTKKCEFCPIKNFCYNFPY